MATTIGNRNGQAGFSLTETVVATSILAVSLVSLAQLLAIATVSNRGARSLTGATVLAAQKMEQLRGLAFGLDLLGLPLTDTETDTAVEPEAGAGGTGLRPSLPEALGRSTTGYVDYLDAFGTSLGGGADPPSGTVYVRRWSIEPLPGNPANALVLQVLVTHLRRLGTATSGPVGRMPDQARLVSIKIRRAS